MERPIEPSPTPSEAARPDLDLAAAPVPGPRRKAAVLPWAFVASFAAHAAVIGVIVVLMLLGADLVPSPTSGVQALVQVPAFDVADDSWGAEEQFSELPAAEEPDYDVLDLLPIEPVEPETLLPEPDAPAPRERIAPAEIPVSAYPSRPRRPKLPVAAESSPKVARPDAGPRPGPSRGTVVARGPLRPTVRMSRAFVDSHYPRAARRAGVEGTAIVEMMVNARGIVVRTRIHESSGSALLDRAAMRLVRAVMFHAPGETRIGLQPIPFRLRASN